MQKESPNYRERLEGKDWFKSLQARLVRLLTRLRIVAAVDLAEIDVNVPEEITRGLDPADLRAQRERNRRFRRQEKKWRGR
jgi:hypothetical protein